MEFQELLFQKRRIILAKDNTKWELRFSNIFILAHYLKPFFSGANLIKALDK